MGIRLESGSVLQQQNPCYVHSMSPLDGENNPFGSRCGDPTSMCVKVRDVEELDRIAAALCTPRASVSMAEHRTRQIGKDGSTIPSDSPGSTTYAEPSIDNIIGHYADKKTYTVSMKVSLEGGKTGLIDEKVVHKKVPYLLSQYWQGLRGRDHATGFDKYHVYKILEQEGAKYLVEWVGFPVIGDDAAKDATWESMSKIGDIAKFAVADYSSASDNGVPTKQAYKTILEIYK